MENELNVLLHDDWEIYGDGTGDPDILMFDPARRLLDISDRYGAKYTFYAEIGQQLNMLNAPGKKWQSYANIWENILKEAVQRGHDVQLHFHPQWIGAELKNNKWKLDYRKWSAGQVGHELLDEWIGRGKQYLERLLKPIDENYRVLSFRAGGWLCQPSTGLYKAFKNHGVFCDVTVMKGRYASFEDGSWLDFRNAVSRYEPWEVDPDDFTQEKKGSGVWELPVFTEESTLPHPLYLLKKSFRPLYYFDIYRKKKIRKGGGEYSPKVVKQETAKEYYGSFGYMHMKHLLSYLEAVNKKSKNNSNIGHLIFLTHSKSFLNYKNFENLLKELAEETEVIFTTTRKYIKKRFGKHVH